eukprot:scaffold4347_cov117-Cylindrotheca_fusiformis.AAC.2
MQSIVSRSLAVQMTSVRFSSCKFPSRLFGSKRGVPDSPLGTIEIYDDQEAIKDIDKGRLRDTIRRISKIIGYASSSWHAGTGHSDLISLLLPRCRYETYDVTLLLVDDEEMRETNLESRGIDAPTDILSFPFHFPKRPGLLKEPEFDIPDYYTLGDMMVDVPYVIRRCQEDKEDLESDDDERGVSGAMADVTDPEKRINMLLVHGMLHLVGYDHEEDDEYEEMVEREEHILGELGYNI